MIERFALVLLLPVLLVGCIAATEAPQPPSIFDYPRAEEAGPADYMYANARNYYDEMQVTEEMIKNLQEAIRLNEARRDYYLTMASQLRKMRGVTPEAKQARYETYLSEVFFIEEEVRRQHWSVNMLRSHYAVMAGKIRRDTRIGKQIEAGEIPAAAY